MSDYEPLDLSPLCNARVDLLGGSQAPAIGRQSFHGLPFLIGPDGADGDSCFIALDGASGSVTIPVGRPAHRVIFAHRLLESYLLEGGVLGVQVADYVFRLSGGDEIRVPIRERYDLAVVGNDTPAYPKAVFSTAWAPFRAVPDQKDSLLPRYEGPWEETGRRQTEAVRGIPVDYWLWAWENPHPERTIESIEIAPKGPRFMVAAVTLGHVDERPFTRQGRREARIVLTAAEDAEAAFDIRPRWTYSMSPRRGPGRLDVQVDRGFATYVQPLPEASAEEFMADSFKGWGEEQNPKASPSYVEVSAVSSATVTVKQGDEEVGKVRWGEVEEKGVAVTPRMRVELMDRGRNWVHVTVLDDDTGQPVPCRVHFRSPEGIPYQPHGHHNQVNSNLGTWHIDVGGDARLGQITYAYIDGRCEGWLPRGDVIVDIARGFEYEPLRTRVKVEPGQRELTLRIKRWTNMNAQRWFSGDSHVHFLSAQGAHTESRAEDLNVVNLLQSQWGSLFTNTEEFIGRPSVSREGDSIVYVSQENRQHFLGHMILWGLKEPVMPWCSDGVAEAELGGTMETTMSHWADRCHDQGGTVVIPHFPNPNGEPATLIATGRVDGVEMIRHQKFNHIEYYRYLSGGYRLPLVGGTDKMSSDAPVGMYRTYVRIPDDEEFNYDNWCKNVARGRTFITGGPIVHFSVEGQEIGDTLQLSGAGTVEVEAWAESILPIHTLEIVQEGRVVASTEDRNGTRRLELKVPVKVDGNTWLAARCGGPNYYDSIPHHDVWSRGVFAHTSPIYVACGGDWEMFNEATARYMLTLIDGGLIYIRETAARHAPGTITHHHGEDDHLAYLQRPFFEARDAVNRRLEVAGLSH